MYIAALNSGSNGNCYYAGSQEEGILVDAGISAREIEKRLKQLSLSIQCVKAIFITHEHIDHIKGLSVISGKYNIPVYITTHTQAALPFLLKSELVQHFTENTAIQVATLTIYAIGIPHDAADAHCFIISDDKTGTKTGIFTDIGAPTPAIHRAFKVCNAAFLESNYCEKMLAAGSYPFHLKKRISGGKGHLSNRQSLDIFLQQRGSELDYLILSHLSANNNTPETAAANFEPHMGSTKLIVASRYKTSPLLHVTSTSGMNSYTPLVKIMRPVQLTLFG